MKAQRVWLIANGHHGHGDARSARGPANTDRAHNTARARRNPSTRKQV